MGWKERRRFGLDCKSQCVCIYRAANNGRSTESLVKNRFCPDKSLDGPTICPVVFAAKEKI